MKKTLLGIAGILAMISSANAVDTSQIKAACQSSDKTLWVERNQVCIPRNPCTTKDEYGNWKWLEYCNDVFRDTQAVGNGYMVLIDLYAQTHNLDCTPVEQRAKISGQDYVVCMGNDVMVFEFGDINDHPLDPQHDKMAEKWRQELCTAVGGGMPLCESEAQCECKGISETRCDLMEKILIKYGMYDSSNFPQVYITGSRIYWGQYAGHTGCFIK